MPRPKPRARAAAPTFQPVVFAAGAEVNTGYSWHLVDVTFVEIAIELCDGLPSHVEAAGVGYANGRYCPWGAEGHRHPAMSEGR